MGTKWNRKEVTEEKNFLTEGDWAQVAGRGYGVPVFGDIQKPSGHYPAQTNLGDPLWAETLANYDFQMSLATLTILWFCKQ